MNATLICSVYTPPLFFLCLAKGDKFVTHTPVYLRSWWRLLPLEFLYGSQITLRALCVEITRDLGGLLGFDVVHNRKVVDLELAFQFGRHNCFLIGSV